MSDRSEPHYDKESVLAACDLPALCGRLGVVLKPGGRVYWAPCPVHAERSASFKVEHREGAWKWKCFGCGAGGNAIDLWMAVNEGVTFKEALRAVAEFSGVGPMTEATRAALVESEGRVKSRQASKKRAPVAEKRVTLPPARRLSGDTMRALAELRGLSVEGIRAACEAGMVWGGMFGVSTRYWGGSGGNLVWGEHMEREEEKARLRVGPLRCWFAGDYSPGTGVAVRRLDGGEWTRHDGGHFKSWAVGTKKIPLGVAGIGERPFVCVVEGEGDLLAAYHFLTMAGVEGVGEGEEGLRERVGLGVGGAPPRHTVENTAVVCVLGAASSVPDDVWPVFEGKRVRLFPHFDKVDAKSAERPGWRGARKWEEALHAAGAEVDCFFFGTDDPAVPPLLRADGEPVKDLNDAARGDAACLQAMEECFGRLWKRRRGAVALTAGAMGGAA